MKNRKRINKEKENLDIFVRFGKCVFEKRRRRKVRKKEKIIMKEGTQLSLFCFFYNFNENNNVINVKKGGEKCNMLFEVGQVAVPTCTI